MNYIHGLLFGLMLQLSVGPVFFSLLHKSIKEGPYEALKMAMGVTIVDAFYICISFTGISALLKIYFFSKIIKILGSIMLIYFGITYIKGAMKASNIKAEEDENNTQVEKNNFKTNSFIYGIKLTFTNPLTIIFWSSTFGSLIASNKITGMFNITLFSLGCISSTAIFLSFISFTGKYTRKYFNKNLDYIIGIVLVCFGISILFK